MLNFERYLVKMGYRFSSRVVALSPGMRDGVQRGGFPADKTSVIPNSSDLDFFDPSGADRERFLSQHPELRGRPLVVYVGTMGIINGVDYLPRIAAASRGLGLDVQFAVVGGGKQESKVRAEAEKLAQVYHPLKNHSHKQRLKI